jgi:hypothetical protein
MERLDMSSDPAEDFTHPKLAAGHRLAAHVVYRLGAGEWGGGADRESCAPSQGLR